MESSSVSPPDQKCYSTKSGSVNDFRTGPDTAPFPVQLERDAEASTESAAPCFTDLPTEILLQIFSWLPKGDLRTVATVCRKCYEIAYDSSLWKAITFTGFRPTTEMAYLLLRKSPGLRYLKLEGRPDAPAIIEEVCRGNEKLPTLVVKARKHAPRPVINDNVLCNLLKHRSDIENLTVKRIGTKNVNFFNVLSQTLHNLKKVDLSIHSEGLRTFNRTWNPAQVVSTRVTCCGFPTSADVEEFCSKTQGSLTSFKVAAHDLRDDAIDAIVQCCHLDTLHLYGKTNLGDVALMKISQLQNLSSFAIYEPNSITTAAWINFCSKRCEKLTALKLTVYDHGDDAMDAIVKCRHLRTLHINFACNISDVGLMKISNLQNLTSLEIINAVEVTEDAWFELMTKPSLSRLKNLAIFDCDSVTEELLNVMKINCQHLETLAIDDRNVMEWDMAKIKRGFARLKKITFF